MTSSEKADKSTREQAASLSDGFVLLESDEEVLLTPDPTHRVGQLRLANKKPVSVKPTAKISEGTTLMMLHDFSQLPVMTSSRSVKGIFSWRSLAQRMTGKKKCSYVGDAMEEAVVIDANRSLFDAARLVAESDCVLIKHHDGTISGILTSYDLSLTFAERSEPFLLLEQIEKHIRNHIEAKLSTAEVREGSDRVTPTPAVTDIKKVGFGDYVRLLQKPDPWRKIGLPLDQTVFVKQLDEIRNIRNRVMHFNPNGLATEDMNVLRQFAGLMRRVQEVMA